MSKLAKGLQAAAGNAGGANTYIEDVFSTYLYTGNEGANNIINNIKLGDSGANVSAVLNGTTDSVVYANGIGALNIGAGDFTVEAWVKCVDDDSAIFAYNGTSTGSFMFSPRGFGRSLIAWDSANPVLIPNAWNHIAVSRRTGVARLYLNGAQVGSDVAYTHSFNFNNYLTGLNTGGGTFNGEISNLRVSATALYRGTTYTVPPQHFVSNQQTLLLVFSGTSVFQDQSSYALTVTNNGATVGTGPFGDDVTGEGGLVWIKDRTNGTGYHHVLQDTERGATNTLFTNLTNAQTQDSAGLGFTFNKNGFSLNTDNVKSNGGDNYTSWTFRKAPKFFDVVTWTGDGASTRQIPHNLGSVPGFIVYKVTSLADNWNAWHRGLTSEYIELNTTNAQQSQTTRFGGVDPTDTVFTVGSDGNYVNQTFVAYLFAHDAGGFGDDGLQNVISCGSYTGNGVAGLAVTLGWEPQWLLIKRSNSTGDWEMIDSMRGIVSGGTDPFLRANTSGQEFNVYDYASLTATGFTLSNDANVNTSGGTYIYIAIRRPMKTPESGTEVFAIGTSTSDSSGYTLTSNFPVDSYLFPRRDAGSHGWVPRLTNGRLQTDSTSTEADVNGYVFWDSNVNVRRTSLLGNASTVDYALRRAPGFFDVVAYTGTGTVGRTVAHNLGVAPELSIIKTRSLAGENWNVWHKDLGIQSPGNYYYLQLNQTNAKQASNDRVSVVSSTTITMGDNGEVNASGATYIAYLFASCPGVSKVGSYTGTGSDINIDCGFSNGARFVLIKNTSAAYNWMLLDTARGITSAGDFYSFLNSTNAEGYGDYIDPYAPGFTVTGTWAAFNQAGDNYIYLAIA